MAFYLEITENTIAKLRPKLSSELDFGESHPLAAGTRRELQSYAYADEEGRFNGHIKFAIANPEDLGGAENFCGHHFQSHDEKTITLENSNRHSS